MTKQLFVHVEGVQVKVGTCDHCVLREKGRPERAWDPDQERSELDFPLEDLRSRMAYFGLLVHDEQEYVCP